MPRKKKRPVVRHGVLGRPKIHIDEETCDAIAKETTFAYWCVAMPIILDLRPFTFEGHEYLVGPYLDKARVQANLKAAQTGFTTRALLRAIHGCCYKYPSGALYLFPTKADVTEFSKTRFARISRENEFLKEWIRDTDAANVKSLGAGYLYFRGMRTREPLKTIPVDLVVFDEYDEHLPTTDKETELYTSPDLALRRLDHSQYKEEMYLSTPTLPDYGIDIVFKASDQKHWFIKCRSCGKRTCLEEEFVATDGEEPSVLMYSRKEGGVVCVCKYCQSRLYTKDGEWVAKRQEKGLSSGYWISQLNSPSINPIDILEDYEIHVLRTRQPKVGRPNPQEFWNSRIGRPWVAATARLTKGYLLKLCTSNGLLSADFGPCVMGVDQGNDFHIVIISLRFGKPTIVFVGIETEWEALDYYIKAFNVICCVVDAQPEKRNAMAFAERFSGRVFANYYIVKGTKRPDYVWDTVNHIVQEDRTQSLDEAMETFNNGEIYLPRSDIRVVDEFIKHCCSVAKRLVVDRVTRAKRYVYVELGPSHFMHAFNYACIAISRTGTGATGRIAENVTIVSERASASPDWHDGA